MRYEPAAANPPPGGCQSGTVALGHAIRAVWPELQCLTAVYGCYHRRRIAGTSTWSLHAEGRALDIGVHPSRTQFGWQLACDLVEGRKLYGTMRVMWAGHIWSLEQGADWRRLKPTTDQHLDHIHVEQYRAAAARPLSVSRELEVALRRQRSDPPGAA